MGGFAVLAMALATGLKVFRNSTLPWLRSPALLLMAAVALQFILGASVIWTRRDIWVASAHVIGGSLVLGTALVLALRLWRAREGGRA
jgi:heme A synthase